MKSSGFGSTTYVRFFWFCSPRGRGGQAGGLSTPPAISPPSELSGVFRISDRSVLVVAADAAGPVEDGVEVVGVDVDPDPRPDEMRPHRALRI